MHHDALTAGLLLLSLSVVAVVLFRRIHLPPVLGYLFVGIVAGPHALHWLPDLHILELLAEIGVVFLLFMIGLEFSLAQFWTLRRAVFGLGGTQVLLSVIAAGTVAWFSGIPWQGALVIGGILALSSTAIVIKQLIEQLEMHSHHGRLAFAVLLFQDIAVVPFLVLIPILGSGAEGGVAAPILLAMLKAVVAVVGMLALGHWLIRPVFHVVAAAHSTELFTLTALLVSLSAAWVTNFFGLSLALGAFLAGMMLSETEFKHQIEIDVRPFRDILMGIFFISVGAQLNLAEVWAQWPLITVLTLGIVVGKTALVAMIVRLMHYDKAVAMRTGIVLANGGEFGFALVTLAIANGLLTSVEAQPVLAAVIFSMMVAPLLVSANGSIVQRLFAGDVTREHASQRAKLSEAAGDKRGHVIFCGYGRIGQNMAGFLLREGIDYVALDTNSKLVKEAWEAGEQVYFGDSTHIDMLHAAGLDRARLIVVTIDEPHASERIIRTVRGENSDVPILVRTRSDASMELLEKAGATLVLPETLEASMMLSQHMLEFLGVDVDEVHRVIEAARGDHYHQLRGYFHGEDTESLEESERPRLHTVLLDPENWAVDKRIAALGLAEVNATVVAVCRDGMRGESPQDDMVLRAGDGVVLEGSAEAVEHGEEILLTGVH